MDTTSKDTMQRELGWDDPIEKDSDYVLLPEGDYNFEVQGFERARHEGSKKLPPCNKAILTLHVWSPAGDTTLRHNLFLHSSVEGLLCAFFTAIGQRLRGERIPMNWQRVVGSGGRCKIGVRTYTNDKGEEVKVNQVTKWYEPDEPKPVAYREGKF